VFVLNVTDGCIPSDMAVGSREEIEEERSLLYVAMTRARQHLHLVQPSRFFRTHQHRHADGHVLAIRSRFIPDGYSPFRTACAQPRWSPLGFATRIAGTGQRGVQDERNVELGRESQPLPRLIQATTDNGSGFVFLPVGPPH
jgi:ATP-dependent exoDNAse (exonuclease V) beta subunit